MTLINFIKIRRVGYLKMKVMEDLKKETINEQVAKLASKVTEELINTYHGIKPEFLQKFLDEFCYKFNRRYAGEYLFNRLLAACVSYKNEFRYIYG